MNKFPSRILVVTFDPETPKSMVSILQEYFECVPHIPYINEFKEVYYVLPDTKTIDYIFNNMYRYIDYNLTLDLLRGGTYEYMPTTNTYDRVTGASIMPAWIRINCLDVDKLEVFSKEHYG